MDDQLINRSVNETHMNEVNVFPGGFDLTLSHRWQGKHFPYEKVYPETFMFHHNGNEKSQFQSLVEQRSI